MKILIETIPHSEQRYPTVGDWEWKTVGEMCKIPDPDQTEPILHIHISEMSDWRHEVLVAVHELVEALLCKYAGITSEQVDAFDLMFEESRPKGYLGEPGDDPRAPYFHEHKLASSVEVRLAGEMEVDWTKYESEVDNL